MASFAGSKRPKQPFGFPQAPVVTQHLSSAQATSTFTKHANSSFSHSPALSTLQKISTKAHQLEIPANIASGMARDNGKRGSYRHVSGSLAKQTVNDIEDKHTSLLLNSPTDSNVSPPLPTNFKSLKRDKIDDLGLLGDRFFDEVPRSFNAKYPIMAIPGSMPRGGLSPRSIGTDRSLSWNQMIIAGGLWGFALFGFLLTMYNGCSAIGAYIWALVSELFGKGA